MLFVTFFTLLPYCLETVGDDTKDGASLETVIPRPTGDGPIASVSAARVNQLFVLFVSNG
jgi:hypothetical protein